MSMMWNLSILFLLFLLYIKLTWSPQVAYFPSAQNLEQTKIKVPEGDAKIDLLDPATGQLAVQGWLENGERHINDNSAEAGTPLYIANESLSRLRWRSVRMLFISTPHHFIQVLTPAEFGPVCANQV